MFHQEASVETIKLIPNIGIIITNLLIVIMPCVTNTLAND